MTNAQLLVELQQALQLDVPDSENPTNKEVLDVLDALIESRRGPATSAPKRVVLSNNLVLKKLRIAFEMKEPETLAAFAAGGMPLSAKEISPYFRKPGTKNFRRCDDEVLSAFLKGLGSRRLAT